MSSQTKGGPIQGEDLGKNDLDEKRKLKNIHDQLEIIVNRQRDDRTEVDRLKKLLVDTETEFRQRIKDSEKHYQLLQEKISVENEQLTLQLRNLQEQLANSEKSRQNISQELVTTKAHSKWQIETYQRALAEKAEENKKLSEKMKSLEQNMKKELDQKIVQFVETREKQYQNEKEEWMRIFKEEFHKKLAYYKDTNKQLEAELANMREWETEKRSLEGEIREKNREISDKNREIGEKSREIDEKIREIREQTQLVNGLQETIKQNAIEYEKLSSTKAQLEQDISLFQAMLNNAVKEAGYLNSLDSGRKRRKTNNGETYFVPTPGLDRARQMAKQDLKLVENSDININNRGQENGSIDEEQENPKKVQYEIEKDTEIGEAEKQNDENIDCSNFINNNRNNTKNSSRDQITKYAQKRKHLEPYESEINRSNEDHDIDLNTFSTPGELPPLQFSSMDLGSSTLEIQNISENEISLKDFYLANADISKKFPLPADRILAANERVKIIVGSSSDLKVSKQDIWWRENVWSGLKDEVARLYDSKDEEIARIEISPDMIPEKVRTRKNCLIM